MTFISLKMFEVVILSVAQLVTTVIFFPACDKSHVKWDNSQNSTQKKRTNVKFQDAISQRLRKLMNSDQSYSAFSAISVLLIFYDLYLTLIIYLIK